MKPLLVRPWVILALIFLLGAATGSLLTIGFGSRFAPGPPGPQEIGNHWMMHLTNRLHLTDDQRAKIQPIIADAEKKIESVYRPAVGQISRIMQDANARIAQELNPDQLAELQKMEQARQNSFRHMHSHGHGPDDFHGPGHDGHPPGPQPDNDASDSTTNAVPPGGR